MLENTLLKLYNLSEKSLAILLRPFLEGRKVDSRQIRTWANVISLVRIPLGLGIVILANKGRQWLAVLIFTIAMVSDHIDGSVARLEGTTYWGRIIDPICDRIFFLLCALAYWKNFYHAPLLTILGLETFIMTAPLVAIKIQKIKSPEADFRPNIFGKTKFVFECIAILMAMLGANSKTASMMLYPAIFLAVMSIYKKARDGFRLLQTQPDQQPRT